MRAWRNIFFCVTAGLSDIKGLEIVNDLLSPIIFLTLKKTTGSSMGDLQVLEDIADHVSKSA